jgi:hypothetical protein
LGEPQRALADEAQSASLVAEAPAEGIVPAVSPPVAVSESG